MTTICRLLLHQGHVCYPFTMGLQCHLTNKVLLPTQHSCCFQCNEIGHIPSFTGVTSSSADLSCALHTPVIQLGDLAKTCWLSLITKGKVRHLKHTPSISLRWRGPPSTPPINTWCTSAGLTPYTSMTCPTPGTCIATNTGVITSMLGLPGLVLPSLCWC